MRAEHPRTWRTVPQGKPYLRFHPNVKPIAILALHMFALTKKEESLFRKLSTPSRIQDFLNTIPINFEKKGRTFYSPRMVLERKKAHCVEGALFAAAVLWYHGHTPLLLDLVPIRPDHGHTVALFRKNGFWGAVSKTNHAVLRYRDPVYKTPRELVMSYFHEVFFDTNGVKTLRSYSHPLNLARFGTKWITAVKEPWYLNDALDKARHFPFIPRKNTRLVRPADPVERAAGSITEWKKNDSRT